ncbi:uncharacterized protein LOC135929309 isoform X2 [Gordionus sp. m RMFG-2023]|uniref:uncharacterized protein LOC135929309 isoform X2 n=1 Tax=Gordionus sp. m RMFG-2023 TaxID=3053472 RepID=UPI0031FDBA62
MESNNKSHLSGDQDNEGPHIPYFLEFFKEIINYILKHEFDSKLLNEDDKLLTTNFNKLSKDCQILYLRIFSRKRRWILIKKINYKNIDILNCCKILADHNFFDIAFEQGKDSFIDLKTLLELLQAPELQTIYRQTFIFNKGTLNKTKMIDDLIKISSKPSIFPSSTSLKSSLLKKPLLFNTYYNGITWSSRASYISSPQGRKYQVGLERTMLLGFEPRTIGLVNDALARCLTRLLFHFLTRCLRMLGQSIRLSETPMQIFLKLLTLYSLPSSLYEKMEEKKNIFYQMLLSKTGKLTFPSYQINHNLNTVIFESRESFHHFQSLLNMYSESMEHFEKKRYESCVKIYQNSIVILLQHYECPEASSLTRQVQLYFKLHFPAKSPAIHKKPTRKILIKKETIRESDDDPNEVSIVEEVKVHQTEAEIGLKNKFLSIMNGLEDSENLRQELDRISAMPEYLRKYSAYSVFLRLESLASESLQKLKKYEKATKLLRHLLRHSHLATKRRGHWWNRLALITEKHLRNPKEAIKIVKSGLEDPQARTGHRLSLYDRYKKLCPKCNEEYVIMPDLETNAIQKITICGKVFPKPSAQGKTIFFTTSQIPSQQKSGLVHKNYEQEEKEEDNPTSLCNVENLALNHYLEHGFTHGVHAEGSVFSTLTFLYFWDEIFSPNIPDTFRNMFQTCPLDWEYDSFYRRRKRQIDLKLALLREEHDLNDTNLYIIRQNDDSFCKSQKYNNNGESCDGDDIIDDLKPNQKNSKNVDLRDYNNCDINQENNANHVVKIDSNDDDNINAISNKNSQLYFGIKTDVITESFIDGQKDIIGKGEKSKVGTGRLGYLIDVVSSRWDLLRGTFDNDSNDARKGHDQEIRLAPVQFPGLNWDVFGNDPIISKNSALTILKCLGCHKFSLIAEVLIKDHRNHRNCRSQRIW